MENEFVPYKQALDLKELGFDEYCLTYYNYDERIEFSDDWAYGCILEDKRDRNQCLAPLYQQVFRWFRGKYMLKGDVEHATSNGGYTYTNWKWNFDNNVGKWERIGVINSWLTYEEAELECLKKLIEIIKQQQ